MTDGYYVFAGTAVGNATSIVNPVFRCHEGAIYLVAKTGGNLDMWRFDEGVGELHSDGVNSTGILANLMTQIGWTGSGVSAEHGIQLEQEMIVAKIYPLSE